MKITIITIVKNCEALIERTVKSVVEQTSTDFEYIIIDGASTDRTLEIIEPYKNRVSQVVSENDKGISDAFNKGITRANGEWILFLNAGDCFVDATLLERIVPALINSKNSDIVYGKINIVNEDGTKLKIIGDDEYQNKMRWHMPFPHQATFHNRKLYEEIGLYDLSFKRAMDYELILRKRNLVADFIPFIISNMLAGGLSQNNYKALFRECARAHMMYYQDNKVIVVLQYAYMLWRVRLILFIRFLIRKELK